MDRSLEVCLSPEPIEGFLKGLFIFGVRWSPVWGRGGGGLNGVLHGKIIPLKEGTLTHADGSHPNTRFMIPL